MKVMAVVGARPNYMKIMPKLNEMKKFGDSFEIRLIHTGQHQEIDLSKVFFDELDFLEPDIKLEIVSGSHAQQTTQIKTDFHKTAIS